ncbi:MAG: hypothetical protein ACRC14_15100 [Paracoccaceae bacterium]
MVDAIVALDLFLHATMLDGSSDTAINTPAAFAAWIGQIRMAFPEIVFTTFIGPLSKDRGSERIRVSTVWLCTETYAGGMLDATAAVGTVGAIRALTSKGSWTGRWWSTGWSATRCRAAAARRRKVAVWKITLNPRSNPMSPRTDHEAAEVLQDLSMAAMQKLHDGDDRNSNDRTRPTAMKVISLSVAHLHRAEIAATSELVAAEHRPKTLIAQQKTECGILLSERQRTRPKR